jgi:hypothetical protein
VHALARASLGWLPNQTQFFGLGHDLVNKFEII